MQARWPGFLLLLSLLVGCAAGAHSDAARDAGADAKSRTDGAVPVMMPRPDASLANDTSSAHLATDASTGPTPTGSVDATTEDTGTPGPASCTCAGKQCGDPDGCGGTCTDCPSSSETCDVTTATCQPPASCTPSCGAQSCGQADGCGGVCMSCPSGASCNTSTGTCQTQCIPNCTGLMCGASDGCGGMCQACPSPAQGCDASGQCEACSLSCPNGTCAFSNDTGGQICLCDAGYYSHYNQCEPIAGSPCDGVACANGTCGVTPSNPYPQCLCDADQISYGTACVPLSTVRCGNTDGTLAETGAIRCSADDVSFEVCRDANGDGTVEWASGGTASCGAGMTCSQCIAQHCDNGDGTGQGGPLQCPTGTVCMGMVHQIAVYKCVTGCDCSNCPADPSSGDCVASTSWQGACGGSSSASAGATIACKSPCPEPTQGCLPYGADSFCFGNEGCFSAPPQ